MALLFALGEYEAAPAALRFAAYSLAFGSIAHSRSYNVRCGIHVAVSAAVVVLFIIVVVVLVVFLVRIIAAISLSPSSPSSSCFWVLCMG